jgi:hypothetical protein
MPGVPPTRRTPGTCEANRAVVARDVLGGEDRIVRLRAPCARRGRAPVGEPCTLNTCNAVPLRRLVRQSERVSAVSSSRFARAGGHGHRIGMPVLIALVLIAFERRASADVPDEILLTNGGRLRGTVMVVDPQTGASIRLLDGTVMRVRASEIKRVMYGGQPPAAPPPPVPSAPAPGRDVGGRRSSRESAEPDCAGSRSQSAPPRHRDRASRVRGECLRRLEAEHLPHQLRRYGGVRGGWLCRLSV